MKFFRDQDHCSPGWVVGYPRNLMNFHQFVLGVALAAARSVAAATVDGAPSL